MTVATELNPTYARRALTAALSRHRTAQGLDLKAFAELLGVTEPQASRLDNGRRGLRIEQVETLADQYGVDGTERDRLLALANEAQQRAWWQRVTLSEDYRTLIGMERAADSISEFCATVIPGLLQTEDYAKASTRIMSVGATDEQIDTAVEVRLHRQDILERPEPPELTVVLDEACLARSPGDRTIMRDQLDHLVKLAQSGPRLAVHVIPFSAGLYTTHSVQLIILRMPDDAPNVTYTETTTTRSIDDDPGAVDSAEAVWRALLGTALSRPDSIDLITKYRNRT